MQWCSKIFRCIRVWSSRTTQNGNCTSRQGMVRSLLQNVHALSSMILGSPACDAPPVLYHFWPCFSRLVQPEGTPYHVVLSRLRRTGGSSCKWLFKPKRSIYPTPGTDNSKHSPPNSHILESAWRIPRT